MTFLDLFFEPNYSEPWGLSVFYLHCPFGMSKENEFRLTESKNVRHKQNPMKRDISHFIDLSLFFTGVAVDVTWQ